MKAFLGSAVLYLALALGANADMTEVESLRDGDMKKLIFHSSPQPTPDTVFTGEDGSQMRLADFAGEYVVLNFWATWCAPCRVEMPMLSDLATQLKDEGVRVVTIATGRNSKTGMRRFFEEIEVTNLPLHTDPKQALARKMGVLGLPITVILDPEGFEIARLRGDAHWNSPSALAILRALVAKSTAG